MGLRAAARDRRNQSQLITAGENKIIVGVLAVDCQQAAAGVDLPAQRGERVGDAGAIGQFKLQRIAAEALTQACK